jgi:hypothetical protein
MAWPPTAAAFLTRTRSDSGGADPTPGGRAKAGYPNPLVLHRSAPQKFSAHAHRKFHFLIGKAGRAKK